MKRIWLLPAALGTAAAFFTEELFRYTFCREASPLLSPFLDKKGHEGAYYQWRDAAADRLRKLPCEEIEILSSRGLRLRGWYYPASGEGKRIAFLVHGYRSEHAETAGVFFDLYASLGFDLFCCDHAAHGESEGRLIGFGKRESEDCLLWLQKLRERFGDDVKILLHGFSMGGATVLKMSGDCPDTVKAIVCDCGYRDGAQQLESQLGPFYQPLRLIFRCAAGYDLSETDTSSALRHCRLPILFVHGSDDKTVLPFNHESLFHSYRGPKDRLLVPGARHMESIYLAPEAYKAHLKALIDTALYFDRK